VGHRMTRGAVYVAYGEPACVEARASIVSLKDCDPALPVTVIGDKQLLPQRGVGFVRMPEEDIGGRWAKLNIDLVSPYDQTLYIDADTRVRQSVLSGFCILDAGWEMAIMPSRKQHRNDWLWHVGEEERHMTAGQLGPVLALQGGVWFMRKTPAVHELFAAWRSEWQIHRQADQAPLLRALYRHPVRMWVLGYPWNKGAIIEHRYGRARRPGVGVNAKKGG